MSDNTMVIELEEKVADYAFQIRDMINELNNNENLDKDLLFMFDDIAGEEIRIYQRLFKVSEASGNPP
ncbi:hypothetical protein GM3708_2025 [Geminocystis sp. NIES-3708]|uniref:hypothetical protein n=1 Tax=Geminocystis sp. NIES-3708 TaxID=1615909 RepID=UPI0005FCD7EC|nr:hypothetical protein [Geminocystis sp. NIES-3708]BAQ61619.1 hypothetical protein GM3708_2025 [Geminocystis sp. NIES-3708]